MGFIIFLIVWIIIVNYTNACMDLKSSHRWNYITVYPNSCSGTPLTTLRFTRWVQVIQQQLTGKSLPTDFTSLLHCCHFILYCAWMTQEGISDLFFSDQNTWKFRPWGNRCLQQLYTSIWINILSSFELLVHPRLSHHTALDMSHPFQNTMEVMTGTRPFYTPTESQTNSGAASRMEDLILYKSLIVFIKQKWA